MLDDFLIRAGLAGVGLAAAAGPLGCFVVWRRMAYFGDATAHAAVLGVALALAFELPTFWGVLIAALAMATMVTRLARRGLAADAALGVAAHSALALGLVAAAFLAGPRLDLTAYLFGDILAVSRADLAAIWGGAALVVCLLAWRWQKLLASTLNADLAFASGVDPNREQFWLTVGLALAVAVGLKVVGALLVGAMLLIPAAAARGFARTPETMALLATLFGAAAAVGGLGASYQWDAPAGPAIVVTAAAIFVVGRLAAAARGRRDERT